MKRRIACLLLAVCMLILTACGESNSKETTETSSVVAQTDVPTTAATTTPVTEAKTEPTEEPTEHTHAYTTEVTDATCTEEGYTTHTCTCGDSYTDTPVAAIGHSYEAKTVDATCEDQGYTIHICGNCGDNYKDGYANALGHQWSSWVTTKAPTLTATGEAQRECATCGAKETKTLPKDLANHTHQYTETVTTAATCTKNGVKTFTCSCGDTYTESINKLGHQYNPSVTVATCTAQGYTTYTCGNCGDAYTGDYTAVADHTYEDVVVNPTCTEKGYTKRTCSRCAHSYTTSETAATGHSYQVTSNTATCTNSGTKTETCSACGHQKHSASAATGHGETKTETVNAGCNVDGYTKVTCTLCGTVISNTIIPANGTHVYETKKMSAAAQSCVDQGDYDYAQYVNFEDWNVNVCKHCEYIDMETLKFAYSDYQAASIMLGYVNSLRESVHGTSDYNLELNSTLIELAKIRAKEISVSYNHGGTYTNASENITDGGINIRDQYASWCNSSGHYKNMIEPTHKYFGYALYKSTDCWSTAGIYGVQLFWNEGDKVGYIG